MNPPRALVLTGFGINCEEELAAAWRLAGANARIAHLNEVFLGRVLLDDFQVVNLPGGFSFGDDLGSGKALANKLRYKRLPDGRSLLQALRRHRDRGGYLLGICNGFQVLVKLGLLPDSQGLGEQEVTLTTNRSGRFEDRWVRCRVEPGTGTPFLRGQDLIELPVRHGEGRLLLRDDGVRQRILQGGLCCLRYCDAQGAPTCQYPLDPNGSDLHCAGLCDPSGRVLGMMPHPEAFLSLYNHPNWPALKRRDPGISEDGQGLTVFRSLVAELS